MKEIFLKMFKRKTEKNSEEAENKMSVLASVSFLHLLGKRTKLPLKCSNFTKKLHKTTRHIL